MSQEKEVEMLEAIFKARGHELVKLCEAVKGVEETTVIGILREEFVKRFLLEFLPERFSIGIRGITISSNGMRSGEVDIIIYDKEIMTFFKPLAFWLGEHVYPCEAVYMVIEVERNLSRERLRERIKKLVDIKKLSRDSYYRQEGAVRTIFELYGREWEEPPIITMIFAYDGEDLKALLHELKTFIDNVGLEPWEHPDFVYILNKGYIVWQDEQGHFFIPSPKSRPVAVVAEPHQTLAFMYTITSHLLSQLRLRPARVKDYMKGMSFGIRCC
jgi:hypothetical protein